MRKSPPHQGWSYKCNLSCLTYAICRNYNTTQFIAGAESIPYSLQHCCFLHILKLLSREQCKYHSCTLPWVETNYSSIVSPYFKVACVFYKPIDMQIVLRNFCSLYMLPKTIKMDFIVFLNQLLQVILFHQISLSPFPSQLAYEMAHDVSKNGLNAITVFTIKKGHIMSISGTSRLPMEDENSVSVNFIGRICDYALNDINELAANLPQ